MRSSEGTGGLSRRQFFRLGLASAIPLGAGLRSPFADIQGGQDSLSGRGARGTLRDPSVVGRPRRPTDAGENNAEIQAI